MTQSTLTPTMAIPPSKNAGFATTNRKRYKITLLDVGKILYESYR